MSANPKSTEAPPERPVAEKPQGRETPPVVAFASLFHKGMVRFAEIQKSALDQVVQHNTDLQNTWTQVYKAPSAPATVLLDLAVQGIERIAAAQKSLVDLAVEQSAMVMDFSKEDVEGAAKGGPSISQMVNTSTDKLIAAEKKVLDFAAEQNALMTDRIKRQFGLADATPAAMAAESFRKGVDAVIETQKEMIDLAAKPVKAAAATAAPKAASA
jgi:hypothetical protein